MPLQVSTGDPWLPSKHLLQLLEPPILLPSPIPGLLGSVVVNFLDPALAELCSVILIRVVFLGLLALNSRGIPCRPNIFTLTAACRVDTVACLCGPGFKPGVSDDGSV